MTMAASTTMTDGRRFALPAHLAAYVGASAGIYAITLAAVTGIQSQADATAAAQRAPLVQGIAELGAGHDELSARLERAQAAYQAAAAAYAAVGGPLADVQLGLSSLADKVAAIDGASRTLPTSVKLPSVSRVVRTTSVPAVHTTTGASGG
jgi:hypothetical protein